VSGTVSLYVNGVASGTTFSEGTTAINMSNIGSDGSEPLVGHLDDVRITPGVARYTGNFTPTTAAFPDS
jgi:hypothetical protein